MAMACTNCGGSGPIVRSFPSIEVHLCVSCLQSAADTDMVATAGQIELCSNCHFASELSDSWLVVLRGELCYVCEDCFILLSEKPKREGDPMRPLLLILCVVCCSLVAAPVSAGCQDGKCGPSFRCGQPVRNIVREANRRVRNIVKAAVGR